MPLTIKITDVKNIALLEFPVPGTGVFVLTGENGSGKTTLLACLVRIGQADSFHRHFKTSKFSKKLDNFKSAQVEYAMGPGLSVTYTYSGYRWEPTPKSNSAALLANSGYSEVIYVAADEGRVNPRKEDFRTNRIKDASAFIRDNANTVLGTQKFSELKTVNVKKGRGQQAFVLAIANGEYVSEKNFSLGELATVKLLRRLESASPAALVIIDELELALHPLAQERLLSVLAGISATKQLTVIFSTHSTTLIRAARPSQLLFLERQGANVACIAGCYPTYALGRIAPYTDLAPDVVLLVEDLNAQLLLRSLIKRALATVFANGSTPSIVSQPIGGWANVLRFFARSQGAFGATTRTGVVLDADCRSILQPVAPVGGIAQGQPIPAIALPADIQQIYAANHQAIKFLPDTPEVGLINEMSVVNANLRNALATEFTNQALTALPLPANVGPYTSPGARSAAKNALGQFVQQVCHISGRSADEVYRFLFDWYVGRLEHGNPGSAAALLAPLVV